MLLCGLCLAQSPVLKQAAAPINIDGSSMEWSKDMLIINEKAKLYYAMSYDKDNLFVVIKTADGVRQAAYWERV